jgi:Cu(I)/Ag(I) efflux system protein CusF
MTLRILVLAAALALVPAAQAAAQPAPQAPQDRPAAERAPRTARGTGVITEIDPKEMTVTLRHEPIPALGWPSMTMAFRLNPPALLQGLKVGQKIGFDTNEGHGLPEITAIRKR